MVPATEMRHFQSLSERYNREREEERVRTPIGAQSRITELEEQLARSLAENGKLRDKVESLEHHLLEERDSNVMDSLVAKGNLGPLMVIHLDANGTTTFWNKATEKRHSRPKELGQDFVSQCVRPHHKSKMERILARAMEGQVDQEASLVSFCDGTDGFDVALIAFPKPHLEHGTLHANGVVLVAFDIQGLMPPVSAPGSIMIEVDESEKVTSWNDAAASSSEVDAIDAMHAPLLKLLAPRSRNTAMTALKMALREHHATELLRVRWENGDRAMLRVQPRTVDAGGTKSHGALIVGMAVPAATSESDHGWEMVRGFLCSAGKQEGVGQLYELDPDGNLIEGVEFQGPIRKTAEKQQLTETIVKPSWRANARAMVNDALEGGFVEPVAVTMTTSDDAVECREVLVSEPALMFITDPTVLDPSHCDGGDNACCASIRRRRLPFWCMGHCSAPASGVAKPPSSFSSQVCIQVESKALTRDFQQVASTSIIIRFSRRYTQQSSRIRRFTRNPTVHGGRYARFLSCPCDLPILTLCCPAPSGYMKGDVNACNQPAADMLNMTKKELTSSDLVSVSCHQYIDTCLKRVESRNASHPNCCATCVRSLAQWRKMHWRHSYRYNHHQQWIISS